MKQPPTVSIVTPAWNAARFVGDTIRSVQRQTHLDWEMLVVDDCSKDDTPALVESLAASDPRVRLIRQKANAGPAMARNAAIEAARGRFVAFLDSDDQWLPTKLERQLAFMQEHSAPLSFTAFRRMTHDGSKVGRLIEVPEALSYRQLLGNTAIATSTAVVDRTKTGDFRMVQTYYDDFALWLSLVKPGRRAFGLNEDLMRYRVVTGSVSGGKLRSARMVWRLYREVEHLPVLPSAWYFTNYAVRGVLKYRGL